ncbi:MAG TPA: glycosyltransferase [Pyrinomonadaceae bacterium]|jgi:GT2 family glycosyltransferase|nr:glycosyltransferase [Pyrinomonadaceae bacterium]
MKKWLQENSPLPAKLLLKGLLVAAVGACVRLAALGYNFGARLLRLAVKHGLDIQEAWNVTRRPQAFAAPVQAAQFGAHDFLFIADMLSGARAAREGESGGQQPRASIIIPVFNKVEFTFQCLRSLLREIDFHDTEVIVVNNASTDATAQLLAHFRGLVTVIDNKENRGFVDACNEGAKLARGEHLVFLNNDTIVLSGWLKHLLETVEGDPSAGAVGSMFLYEDGRVQEAGAGVWRNGAAFHYGWGGSPDDRRYSFAREVDYCSGASLLVRRELFEQLGGFDRRYAPAYYEDADICFGVRSLGYKVVYQPMSRVIHYEGATAGQDATTGFKRYQTINRAKFVEKWREVLEREHLPEDPARTDEASNRNRAPLVIVFDERIPTPDRDAGSARMMFILKSLARTFRPIFVPLNRPHGIEYERLLWKEGIETANIVEYHRLLRERKFQAAILSRPLVADGLINSLRRINPSLRIVFDMVDAHFIRLEREYEVSQDERTATEAARYREIELRLARACNLVWCASPEDREAIARDAPEVRIEIVPTIHPLRPRGRSFAEREHLLFLGNLAHRPNADAVHHFIQDIFPIVKRALPQVKLYVVGDNVTPEIAAYDSADVRVLGYVPDVEPLFRDCRLMVVPLRYGAGIKGKLGESLSYGLPVVTTSTGAEGFGLTGGVEALIADDPHEFAAAVVRAYERADLWERLAEHGYRHIEKHFTPEVVAEVIDSSVRAPGATEFATRAGATFETR